LTRLDGVEGNPMLQVTDNCVQLIEALSSTYIYKEIRGSKGAISDVPCKDHFASDLANALEYLCLYRRAEMEPPAVGVRKSSGPPLLGGVIVRPYKIYGMQWWGRALRYTWGINYERHKCPAPPRPQMRPSTRLSKMSTETLMT